ncbi:MAG: chorismate synthase [Lachnospiraceae bacterium]|nr:chorismate synthase [Lachnospiraceae bacterium]
MAGSSFGKIFTVTTWGEPLGNGTGVIIDGVPAGLKISENDIQAYLNKRKPFTASFEPAKHESDFVSINSGLTNDTTNGMPIAMSITNSSAKSKKENGSDKVYRPGQDDYTFDAKFGSVSSRGVGNAVWRETAARVAAGAVAKAILEKMGITFCSYVRSIGPVKIKYGSSSTDNITSNALRMPDMNAAADAFKYLEKLAADGNSAGGVVEVVISGVPAGIGEPVFNKLDAKLAQAIMSIGLVNAVEFGDGFEAAESTGAENADTFGVVDGKVEKKTNNSGGMLGGISDGSEIILRASVMPVPAVGMAMKTVTSTGKEVDYKNESPAETTIVPRAVVVVEAMTAIALVDMLFENMLSRMDRIEEFYRK